MKSHPTRPSTNNPANPEGGGALVYPAKTSVCRVAGINLLLIGLVVVCAEMIWGGWFDTAGMRKICRYVQCSANYQYVSQFTGTTQFTKDAFGLRGRASPQSDIDILVVGGSTSDQRKLNDHQTWDQMLEDKFTAAGRPLEIVSAGIDGQSTFGHLWNFERWFPAIPNFRPKHILFYLGINDLLPRANTKRHDNVHQWGVFDGTLEAIRNNSVLYEIYHTVNGMREAVRNRVHRDSSRAKEPYTVAFDPTRNDWAFYQQNYLDKQFLGRLERLVRSSAELGAQPIFVTQRTARWRRTHGQIVGAASGGKGPREVSFAGKAFAFTNADYGHAEQLLSETILGFCRRRNLLCFDGHSSFQIDKSTTYDLVHTTPKGSAEIASKLYQFLSSKLP